MTEKTISQAFEEIQALKAELKKGVIKGHTIPELCDANTLKNTGFAIILTLDSQYEYSNKILDYWNERFMSDDYLIKVNHNQLKIQFNIRYD